MGVGMMAVFPGRWVRHGCDFGSRLEEFLLTKNNHDYRNYANNNNVQKS